MQAQKHLPILMFSSLPASGKSESRRYLKSLTKEQTDKFHLGETSTQVDDYPYVDAMRKIDAAAEKVLGETVFFDPKSTMFFNSYDWGTLVYMINDDYFDIKRCDPKIPERFCQDPVEWLFNRYESLEGKTIVFEFARGVPEGASFPLKPPFGYSLALFDKEILENAAILYIWVTPEMSYNKNLQRAKEGQEGKSQTVSTQLSLNHGVPHNVMKGEYGTDDIDYLLGLSPKKGYLPIKKDGEEFHIRCGRFDNRVDLTADFRKPQKDWTKEQIKKMEDVMKAAFDALLGEH